MYNIEGHSFRSLITHEFLVLACLAVLASGIDHEPFSSSRATIGYFLHGLERIDQ